jgi:two-component system nitrate/nitrite response regulator NarL
MRNDQRSSVTIRVLVADSSVIHTELLAQAIARDRRIRVVDLSASTGDVLKGVLEAAPDVLVISETLDQRATGGVDIIRQIRASHPQVKSIVLLDTPRRESVVQAFRAGARGIFCRNNPVKTLCKCIAVVNEGQIWASSSELLFLLDALNASHAICPGEPEILKNLSLRERDVVTCLAEGLSNREIATRLSLSQHTVKNYMFRIFEKLGVSSRLELVFFVMSRTDHASLPSPFANSSMTRKARLAGANGGGQHGMRLPPQELTPAPALGK